jgi:hypothetical protein
MVNEARSLSVFAGATMTSTRTQTQALTAEIKRLQLIIDSSIATPEDRLKATVERLRLLGQINQLLDDSLKGPDHD